MTVAYTELRLRIASNENSGWRTTAVGNAELRALLDAAEQGKRAIALLRLIATSPGSVRIRPSIPDIEAFLAEVDGA